MTVIDSAATDDKEIEMEVFMYDSYRLIEESKSFGNKGWMTL